MSKYGSEAGVQEGTELFQQTLATAVNSLRGLGGACVNSVSEVTVHTGSTVGSKYVHLIESVPECPFAHV